MMRLVVAMGLALLAWSGLGPPARADGSGQAGVPVTANGARCDGTTDDTAAIAALLASLKTGGTVRIPAGRFCRIGSGDLRIPRGVMVIGEAAPDQRQADPPGGSGFLLDSAYTIVMQGDTALRDLMILRAGLVKNPSDAEAIAAVETWGRETSHAVTLDGDGIRLEHLFIEGFNTGIYGFGWGTFIIRDVAGDDYNGIFITGAGDNAAILDTRFEPFYAIHSNRARVGAQGRVEDVAGNGLRFRPEDVKNVQPGDYAGVLAGPHAGAIAAGTKVVSVDLKSGGVSLDSQPAQALAKGDVVNFGGSWGRPGVSFYVQGNGGNTTGWYCERCFSFMYRHGMVIDGAGMGSLTEGDFEYQHAFDPGTDATGTFGLRLAGGSSGVTIARSSFGGQAIELMNDMAPPHWTRMAAIDLGVPDFIITTPAQGPKAVAGAWFSGATGEPVVLTLSGNPADAPQVLRVNGHSFAVPGKGGARRVLSAWDRAVNSDSALAAQHVVAEWSGDRLTLYAPPAVMLSVETTLAGAMTATQDKGKPSPGAWGMVDGLGYAGSRETPAVVVAPHDGLPLLFNDIASDNNGHVGSGTFAIDPTSTKVQFLSYPAGAMPNGAVSACGQGASLAAGSTALRGTILEGRGATGCKLTFPTDFPRAPFCTVSSPTGTGLAGYSVTPGMLMIRHPPADGAQFSFVCSP